MAAAGSGDPAGPARELPKAPLALGSIHREIHSLYG